MFLNIHHPLVRKLVNGKLFLQFTAVNFQSILVVTTFINKSLKVVKTLVKLVKIGKNGKTSKFLALVKKYLLIDHIYLFTIFTYSPFLLIHHINQFLHHFTRFTNI